MNRSAFQYLFRFNNMKYAGKILPFLFIAGLSMLPVQMIAGSIDLSSTPAQCGDYFYGTITAGPEYRWFGVEIVAPDGSVATNTEVQANGSASFNYFGVSPSGTWTVRGYARDYDIFGDWGRRYVGPNYTYNVSGRPSPIVTSESLTYTVGGNVYYSINATDYTACGISGGSCPPGVSWNSSYNRIMGTPTSTGTYTAQVFASNESGTGYGTVTFTILPRPLPTVTSESTWGIPSIPFRYQIKASTGVTGYNATGLPAGLAIDGLTGWITGTPTVEGLYIVTISASNESGTTTGTLALTVQNQAYWVYATPISQPGQRLAFKIKLYYPQTYNSTRFTDIGSKSGAISPIDDGIGGNYQQFPPYADRIAFPLGWQWYSTTPVEFTWTDPSGAIDDGSGTQVRTIWMMVQYGMDRFGKDHGYPPYWFFGCYGIPACSKTTQSITFSNPGSQVLGTGPISLTAAASSGLPVVFSVASGPATISGSTLTFTGAGTVVINADQAGNGTYAAARVQQAIRVTQGVPPQSTYRSGRV